MRKIRLEKLILNNFKGIQSGKVTFPGEEDFNKDIEGIKDAVISGEGDCVSILSPNGRGKTTLYDAWIWLLTDKDSCGNSNSVKPRDSDGNDLHHLDMSVCAVINDDGVERTLTKILKEEWRSDKLTGHTTEYFIDGAPIKKKSDFDLEVFEIFGEDETINILSNPVYFCGKMPWKDQRRKLLGLTGKVTISDICSSTEELSGFPDMLGPLNPEKFRAKAKAEKSEAVKKKEEVDTRLKENGRSMPDRVDKKAVDQAEKEIAKSKEALKAIGEKKSSIENGVAISEKKAEIAKLSADTSEARAAHNKSIDTTQHDILREKKIEKKDQIEDLKSEINILKKKNKSRKEEIDIKSEEIRALGGRWQEIRSYQYDDVDCPTCGASPEHHEKDLHAGIREKNSKELERIERKGSDTKKEVGDLFFAQTDAADELKRKSIELQALLKELGSIEKSISKLEVAPAFEELPEYLELKDMMSKLELDLDGLRKDSDKLLSSLEEEERSWQRGIDKLEEIRSSYQASKAARKRQKELEEDFKAAASAEESAIEKLHLVELFERSEAKMIEDSVNGFFPDGISFNLFKEQLNEGIKQICEVTVDGVPYKKYLNTAGKIKVGLEVIKVFNRHYMLTLPVFVDRRESVNAIPDMDCQVINLVVVPELKTK